jgi:DNA-binding transcriptional regulator YiaG
MRTDECTKCGARAKVVRGHYEFTESGLPVVLENIDLVKCAKCGNVDPIIPKPTQLMATLAKAVIMKSHPLNGAELRFLRKHLGKNGEDFAKLLHVDKTFLSKWENDANPIGDQSDRLIRLIVAGLLEDFRKEEIVWTIKHLPDISDETSAEHIVVDPQKMSYRYVA